VPGAAAEPRVEGGPFPTKNVTSDKFPAQEPALAPLARLERGGVQGTAAAGGGRPTTAVSGGSAT